jgi:hypothetical protein
MNAKKLGSMRPSDVIDSDLTKLIPDSANGNPNVVGVVPFVILMQRSQRGTVRIGASPAITKLLEVGGDDGVQPYGFLLLLAERGRKPSHLLLERFAIILDGLRSDVAARR